MQSNQAHLHMPSGQQADLANQYGASQLSAFGNTRPQIKLKYKTDLDKAVLVQNFEKRGWQKAQGDEDWNVFWALPWSVK